MSPGVRESGEADNAKAGFALFNAFQRGRAIRASARPVK
jgi:hypothetical protein